MKSRFIHQIDHDQIVRAIQAAEEKTSGEIRVRITHRKFFLFKDEMHFARRAFKQMKMAHTPDRNAVLIVLFPQRRQTVILGDHAAHDKLGQTFWDETVAGTNQCFKAQEYTRGIIHAIQMIGDALAQHFPKTKTDPDLLPDEVIED